MQTFVIIIQAVATVILAIVTIIYVRLTSQIAKQAKKQTDISEREMKQRLRLKKQKIKILKVLSEIDPSYDRSSEEIAKLTLIHPDEIEGPLIVMIAEGIIGLNDSGKYVLRRIK